ncbi:outer membrane efflux family protein [Glaesserella parasuis D74]|nr:outer membrane efflux family protein [Glaesserella parasuis D74]
MLSSFLSISTYANPLKTILQQNLSNAPEVKEALANVEAAQNRVEQSKSQHFPIVSVTGSKTLRQYHKYEDNYGSTKIIPGIQAEMNIFAFGAIEKDIERSYKEKEYYKHTYTATQEEIAYTIGQLYLTALNMKEAISVMEKSLFRHQKILQDLDIIMENDEGRESEFVQAETRMLMVQQEINNYRQKLLATLNTLSKYTKTKVVEEQLSDPFLQLKEEQLYQKYTLKRKEDNPLYQASISDLDAKNLSVDAEKKKQLPRINLVGSATQENRQIGLKVEWEVFNRGNNYIAKEKASQISASRERLLRTARDIEEGANLAKINIKENRVQLGVLKKQIVSSEKVIDFYRMQFDIARRTLLDVLNAEKELSNVELSYATTQHNLRLSILDYLYTQGMISTWGDVKKQVIHP